MTMTDAANAFVRARNSLEDWPDTVAMSEYTWWVLSGQIHKMKPLYRRYPELYGVKLFQCRIIIGVGDGLWFMKGE